MLCVRIGNAGSNVVENADNAVSIADFFINIIIVIVG